MGRRRADRRARIGRGSWRTRGSRAGGRWSDSRRRTVPFVTEADRSEGLEPIEDLFDVAFAESSSDGDLADASESIQAAQDEGFLGTDGQGPPIEAWPGCRAAGRLIHLTSYKDQSTGSGRQMQQFRVMLPEMRAPQEPACLDVCARRARKCLVGPSRQRPSLP